MRGSALDAAFGCVGNVAGQRRVVEDDGNRGRRKSAALGNVADGDRGRLRPFAGGIGRAAGFHRRGISRRVRIGRIDGLLEFKPLAGGHYRTMSLVSSIRAPFVVLLLLFLSSSLSAQSGVPAKTGAGEAKVARDPQKLFEAGEAALHAGALDEAEHEFRQVLTINPGVAGAYANLGVIHMRRKQWPQALEMLHKAEKLAPDIAGIRLNIGLVYYRKRNFLAAIEPFESVVRQTPGSYQARYLLGFCYFFDSRWKDTVATLEPLWEQVSPAEQLHYLYVLGRAARSSKNAALEEKAYARMAEIGQGSPEFRMIIGKAHLNRGEYDEAVRELEAAARGES